VDISGRAKRSRRSGEEEIKKGERKKRKNKEPLLIT
jgi:hypothetical protein